eukprot:c19248_g1_i1.p1 GENE.c19248_g1_i1~~c19248_g1_i1.p1  ORF type:complete len:452 (+),score=183.35 c19248_g1_i1:54-1409(+)
MGQGNMKLIAEDPHLPVNPSKTYIVCGSGVIGSATCLYLAHRGHKVICLEKRNSEDEGTKFASYRNGGLLCPSLYSPWISVASAKKLMSSVFDSSSPMSVSLSGLNYDSLIFCAHASKVLVSDKSKEQKHSLYKLAQYSMKHFTPMLPRAGISNTAEGTLQLSKDIVALTAIHQLTSDFQCDSQQLDEKGCIKLIPQLNQTESGTNNSLFSAGVFSKADSSGDIFKFTKFLIKEAKSRGVVFHYGAEVSSLETDKDKITAVKTKDGREFKGDGYVLAMGLQTKNVAKSAGVHVPLLPVKGYVLQLPLSYYAKQLKYNVVEDQNKLYVCPIGRTIHISGRAEICGEDYSIDTKKADKMLSKVVSLFEKNYFDEHLVKVHTCIRPISPDDVPIIGKSTQFDNLFLNAGHGSKGWTQCLGSAALLAHIIDGTKPPIDPFPYSPQRFDIPTFLIR